MAFVAEWVEALCGQVEVFVDEDLETGLGRVAAVFLDETRLRAGHVGGA
jgi:hypothetical protein